MNHVSDDESAAAAAVAAATAGRPSRATLRRRANLQALLAEFSLRPMDATAVATLLQCSSASAYQYINVLFDNAVIDFCRDAGDATIAWRKLYRLNPDPLHARQFQAKLV